MTDYACDSSVRVGSTMVVCEKVLDHKGRHHAEVDGVVYYDNLGTDAVIELTWGAPKTTHTRRTA